MTMNCGEKQTIAKLVTPVLWQRNFYVPNMPKTALFQVWTSKTVIMQVFCNCCLGKRYNVLERGKKCS